MTAPAPISVTDTPQALDRLVQAFEGLSPDNLPALVALYAANARFKDPFNEVQGQAAIEAIFRHMFTALHGPRFVVTERVQQGRQVFLTWDFHFRFRRFDTVTPQTVRGASHLVFNDQGRVTLHRDYWTRPRNCTKSCPWWVA